VSNKDESARLFKSSILEFFTHVHWSVPIIVYAPVVTYFLWQARIEGLLSGTATFSMFLAGLFIWTLTEYLLHRFVFHYQPKSAWGQQLHFLMHGVHHDYPNDSKRLVMPPSVSIPLALLFYGLFYAVFGPFYMKPFIAGFLLGYIFYDEIHFATHHAPLKGKVGLWLKHHHVRHHYKDPEKGFGVSSPLWDYVFGTMDVPEEDIAVER
jgi:sterol desaturase/sphingolipid hydroxylase (fatty acid hydroxylase superfamily)